MEDIVNKEYKKGFNLGYLAGSHKEVAQELTSIIEKAEKAQLAYSKGILAGIRQAEIDTMAENLNQITKNPRLKK